MAGAGAPRRPPSVGATPTIKGAAVAALPATKASSSTGVSARRGAPVPAGEPANIAAETHPEPRTDGPRNTLPTTTEGAGSRRRERRPPLTVPAPGAVAEGDTRSTALAVDRP